MNKGKDMLQKTRQNKNDKNKLKLTFHALECKNLAHVGVKLYKRLNRDN